MNPRPARTPLVLLGLLTVLTVAGPIAISRTIRGGRSPRWPPDRPVEWWTFGLLTGGFLVVMAACLAVGLLNWRQALANARDRKPPPPPPPPVDESFNSD
jgi:hypothetical protein